MSEVIRVDRGALGEARIDHNGNLIVKGVLTRTGVFTYQHRDKETGNTFASRELRHPDDVFDARSVASFAEVPVTDDHPTEGRVTTDNSRKLSVGNIGDSIYREGPHDNLMAADLIIRDSHTIGRVLGRGGQPRKISLSCGYKADVVEESGEYMGERYDHRQTNIRGNHVALVRNPRAGAVARLMLDSTDAVLDEDGDSWLELQDTIEQTIEDALKAVYADDRLDDKQRNALSEKISKIANEHPDWENDQVVAVAHRMLGISRPGKKDDDDVDDDHPSGKNKNGGPRVIGQTSQGLDVHANHKHNDPDDWSVEDHREAGHMARREHEKLRGALATAQQLGLGAEYDTKIKGHMAEVKKTHDHHKKEAMTLDSSIELDADGWMPEFSSNPKTRGDFVPIKIKRGPVTIGSGDTELHLDELKIEVDNESEEPLEALLARQDAITEFAQELYGALEEARGEAAGWKAKADEAMDNPERLDELTRDREEILAIATGMGFKRDDMRPLRNDEIKRNVVEKRLGSTFKADDEYANDEKFIDGVWSTIKADAEKVRDNTRKFSDLHRNAAPHREDTAHARPGDGGDDRDDDLTYRQDASRRLKGIHSLPNEELRKRGFN